MLLHFTKMHGLGNDFMLVDAISQQTYLNQGQIERLAHRNFGVGFDQLLIIEPPQHPEVDFHVRIFNADGSEAGHCGNGVRCVAKYVRQRGLCWKQNLRISTSTATIDAKLEENGLVTVNMGQPRLQPEKIPLRYAQQAESYSLQHQGLTFNVGALSMGNPHCVVSVTDVTKADVNNIGAGLSQHSYFPDQANVGFMQVVDPETINLRVFERGVGETLACGTGACAAMVVSRLQQKTQAKVKVNLPGGNLWIEWHGEGHDVFMTGPAKSVFEGQIEL